MDLLQSKLMAIFKLLLYIFCVVVSVEGSSQDKIDVVYTWVDGDDPAWQNSFYETINRYQKPKVIDAILPSRFRSHDELKYSLRSIWKFAPFVHHIYIVTANQVPKWLKPHPKITIVSHGDIFTSKKDLPTFNSQAIEANLHHIENLKDDYIYFNDDVFLGAPVSPRTFFSKSGMPKMFLASWVSPDGLILENDQAFEVSWKNTNALLNRIFGNKTRHALEHAPFAFKRSLQQTIEQRFHAQFKRVSSHKFRAPDDIVITAGFSQHYLHNFGLVKRAKIQCHVVGLKDNLAENRQNLAHIAKLRPTTFCLEDAMTAETIEQTTLIRAFLESYFPEAAPWEAAP